MKGSKTKTGGVIWPHDNALPPTAKLTQNELQKVRWEPIPHSHYSPDLAPLDFRLFGLLKKILREIFSIPSRSQG